MRLVRLPATPSFEAERVRFRFAFTCEDCAHFDPLRAICRHEYPTAEHRRLLYQSEQVREIVFCKEFELQ